MTAPSLKIIGVIKKCSATQDELIAHIQAFDKKPEPIAAFTSVSEPIAALIETITPNRRRGRPRKYETRDMRAEA